MIVMSLYPDGAASPFHWPFRNVVCKRGLFPFFVITSPRIDQKSIKVEFNQVRVIASLRSQLLTNHHCDYKMPWQKTLYASSPPHRRPLTSGTAPSPRGPRDATSSPKKWKVASRRAFRVARLVFCISSSSTPVLP